MSNFSRRTAPVFVDVVSIVYLIVAVITFFVIYTRIPCLPYLSVNVAEFSERLFFTVTGALTWPGTLLSLAVFGG